MSGPSAISPFRLGIKGEETVSADTLAALCALPAFRIVAAALPDPLLIVDADDNILFLNAAMVQISGIPAASAERLPLTSFLRRAGFRLEENTSSHGQTDGSARLVAIADGRFLPVQRRVLANAAHLRGHQLYIVRGGSDTPALPRRGGRAAMKETVNPGLTLPPGLEEQIRRATKAYRRGVRILLLGESGTGKTMIARHIHDLAAGKDAPFIHVNCGGIPETLFESEMFGYERGAFTGALQAGKRGFIEAARGGTLFLDEIGEIPPASQAKLLKFLEDSTIQPVGSPLAKRIETTVITATNRDLRSMIAQGRFRGDLFYRISTFPVLVPALRERPDREALLDALLAKINRERQPPLRLAPDCRAALLAAPLPGNVRELAGIIDYLDIVADEIAQPEHLQTVLSLSGSAAPPLSMPGAGATLKELTAAFEDQVLREAIAKYGSKREAAQRLGIDNATLIRKLRRLPNKA
jgi:transcriptional regulator with PAS, ATPase and Fis domain